jgi:hypothetical protein
MVKLIALTIGLAHSRAAFAYTRVHSFVGAVVLFLLPTGSLLGYQWVTTRKEKKYKEKEREPA